jgi:class 3 adenylate cyclase
LFSLVNVSHFLLAWGLRGGIALFLVLFGLQLPHPERWDGTWLTLQLRTWGDPIVAGVAAWTGFQWPSSPSMSFLPLGLALAVWFVKVAADAGSLRIQTFLRPPVSSTLKAQDPATLPAEGGVPEAVDSEHAREDLLRRYREIEGALRAAKRKRCAFLSIDVAGSTVMKESEQAMAVDVTFQAYMNMLEDVFARYGAWKQTWTPDGVMVCFLQVDVAVAAAQSVLRRLRKFNRSENLLKTRISVRCGLNEGEVPIFEDSKLEKIAHQVLDVTGHMQKHANPDTLWLSAEVFKRLDDKSGFRPASKEVDGHQVYEWSARLAAPQPAPAFPALQPRPGNSDPTWY